MKKILVTILFFQVLMTFGQDVTVQTENLTIGGPYAGAINNPFNGVAFYGNGDKATGNVSLPTTPGLYKITARGASSSNSEAKIDLFVGGNKLGVFSFNGTSAANSIVEVSITGNNNNRSLELILNTDTGANDTYVDRLTFSYEGAPPPPRAAPVIPSTPSFQSGVYRNMFVESGRSAAAVQQKVDAIWNQFFVNGNANNQKLYYEVGNNMAYILDTGNNDIRSEGQSYGMMICVQLGKKAQFDKLWRFAKTYSQHPVGSDREGLFSWELNRNDFSMEDANSAPDGEEYYVTALFFADAIWGSNTGIDYRAEANYILDSMLNKPAASSGSCPTDLIDLNEQQVVFGICGNSATFTDPSYHLPAFYEIWAREADNNRQLWADMAVKSRTYLLPRAAHPVTGLMPDYSEFDGTPKNNGTHGNFEYDAWRNIMNMGFDFAWFQKSKSSIQPLINRQINFFKDKPGYASLWTLDGSNSRLNDHSPGLVACNAVGSLALEDSKVWPFIDELWDTGIPSGQYRYYDGLLYMMSFMHLAGQFKALTNDVINPPDDCNGTAFPTATVSKTNESTSGANDGKITFSFDDVSGRSAIEFSNNGGSTYPLNAQDNAGSATFSNLAPGTYDVWTRWGNNDCPTNLGSITINAGGSNPTGQSAFAVQNIPGTTQAENYDNGGQGVAYNDANPTNNGGKGRTNQGVDIQNTSDNGGGTNVGWIANGEWLEYTIKNVTAGTYKVTFRVASTNGNTKSINAKLGANNLGTVNVPNTNGWQSWQNVTLNNVGITNESGNQVLRLNMNGGSFNINWVKFEATDGSGDGGDCDNIEAESNSQNYYQLNNNNGIIDNIGYSHWMKFDNVNIAGGKFTYRYSKGNNENGYMKVRIDGNNDSNNIATIYPTNTGGWNSYQEKTVNISGTGSHTVYLYFHNASKNIQLDWIRFGNCDRSFTEDNQTDKFNIAKDFEIYPNPSQGQVTVAFENYKNIDSVTLFDISGRRILTQTQLKTQNLEITNLKRGIYLVAVAADNQKVVKKLIVN